MVLRSRPSAVQPQDAITASNSSARRSPRFDSRFSTLCSATKWAMCAALFYYLGLNHRNNGSFTNPDSAGTITQQIEETQKVVKNSIAPVQMPITQSNSNPDGAGTIIQQIGETQKVVKNSIAQVQMPITQSTSNGFNPIYVYSQATRTAKPKKLANYGEAKQDLLISALMDANDEMINSSPLKGPDSPSASQRNLRSNDHAQSGNNRYFVDLAANHATIRSNSYLLEQKGWNGLCIEPNPIYWYELAAYRKCTIIGAFVGGPQEEDGTEVDVHMPKDLDDGGLGGIVAKGLDNSGKRPEGKRNLVSILTVFQETNAPSLIDYFSLDVEGAETIVMNKFPWDLYKIKFMTIERPKDDLKDILKKNGYIYVMQLTNYGETLWIHESVALPKDRIKKIWKSLLFGNEWFRVK